jgi:putative drug exporter of the RND superfamily
MVAAIVVDATILRVLLVPAVMHVLGCGNGWLPRGMARRLPQLPIEGPPIRSARPLDDAEPVPSG